MKFADRKQRNRLRVDRMCIRIYYSHLNSPLRSVTAKILYTYGIMRAKRLKGHPEVDEYFGKLKELRKPRLTGLI